MKKFYTLASVILLIISISVTASLATPNYLRLVSYDTLIKGTIEDELKIHGVVENSGPNNIDVKFKLEILELGSTHSLLVCWGTQCLPPIAQFGETLFSELLTLTPGKNSGNDFKCTIEQGGGLGTTIVKFTYWDNANPTDEVSFTSTVIVGESDVKDEQSKSIAISPNPATDFINLNLSQVNANSVNLSDLNGKLLKSVELQNGTNINISDLNNGIYVISFYKDGLLVKTEKFIVNR